MSMDEGLQSTEVSVIKNARAVAKGQVTKVVNLLDNLLLQNTDGSFIFDEIDNATVGEAHANLLTSYDKFQDLHERYIYYARLEEDENEKRYTKNVAEAFSAANRKYVRYKKSSDKLEADKKAASEAAKIKRKMKTN